jgi:hypothetical protein
MLHTPPHHSSCIYSFIHNLVTFVHLPARSIYPSRLHLEFRERDVLPELLTVRPKELIGLHAQLNRPVDLDAILLLAWDHAPLAYVESEC